MESLRKFGPNTVSFLIKKQKKFLFRDCLVEKPSCVQKFFFSTGFHNAVTWRDRFELLQAWRAIAKEYHQFNLTIYEDFSMYSDQVY
jgi:hypothetical protein